MATINHQNQKNLLSGAERLKLKNAHRSLHRCALTRLQDDKALKNKRLKAIGIETLSPKRRIEFISFVLFSYKTADLMELKRMRLTSFIMEVEAYRHSPVTLNQEYNIE